MIDDNNIVNICFGGTFRHNITQHQDTTVCCYIFEYKYCYRD